MIVTGITTAVRRFGGDLRADWRCLARRGMLYSECESVDFLSLAAGALLTLVDEVDEAVLVVLGTAVMHRGGAAGAPRSEQALGERSLVLVPAGEAGVLVADGDGVDLLLVRAWPKASSAALPPRVPELVR